MTGLSRLERGFSLLSDGRVTPFSWSARVNVFPYSGLAEKGSVAAACLCHNSSFHPTFSMKTISAFGPNPGLAQRLAKRGSRSSSIILRPRQLTAPGTWPPPVPVWVTTGYSCIFLSSPDRTGLPGVVGFGSETRATARLEAFPFFQDLEVDAAGNVWVLRSEPPWSKDPYHWDVFDPEGKRPAGASVPFGLLGPSFRTKTESMFGPLNEIGKDYLLLRPTRTAAVASLSSSGATPPGMRSISSLSRAQGSWPLKPRRGRRFPPASSTALPGGEIWPVRRTRTG